jgi:hypothetical protein
MVVTIETGSLQIDSMLSIGRVFRKGRNCRRCLHSNDRQEIDSICLTPHKGDKGQTGLVELSRGKKSFLPGKKDTFAIKQQDIGDIKKIFLLKDDQKAILPPWYVCQITISKVWLYFP